MSKFESKSPKEVSQMANRNLPHVMLCLFDPVFRWFKFTLKPPKNRVKQGKLCKLCLHMPSTEFAHAQLRVNRVCTCSVKGKHGCIVHKTIISRVKVVQQQQNA